MLLNISLLWEPLVALLLSRNLFFLWGLKSSKMIFASPWNSILNLIMKLWILSNMYAPCTYASKREFVNWFKNIQMPDYVNWLIIGDFNLYRSPADRNKPGGDIDEMYLFNEAISALGIVELLLKGRRFTWTNKQASPLLERLDWLFTSTCWTMVCPSTFVYPLVMETSDHVPCVVSISTSIPRKSIFRFENYWMEH